MLEKWGDKCPLAQGPKEQCVIEASTYKFKAKLANAYFVNALLLECSLALGGTTMIQIPKNSKHYKYPMLLKF